MQSDVSNNDEIAQSQEGTLSVTDTDQSQDSRRNNFPGFNLYIKNLDDSFTDAILRQEFDRFGTITSAKVMCHSSGKSKGFGFVCFTTEEEANSAVAEMNGKLVGSKPLYVAMAQKKEERKHYLNSKYRNLNPNTSVYRPPVFLPPTGHVQESMPASYVPGVNAVTAPMPLGSVGLSNSDTMNSNSAAVTYVMPRNPPMTYMPMYYQPLYLIPNLNVVQQPAPAPPPVLHQPIFLHSSKTNTLIYSTGVPVNPPQIPIPGVQVYTSTSNNVESTGVAVHTIPARDAPAKQKRSSYDDQDGCMDALLADEFQNKAIVSSDIAN